MIMLWIRKKIYVAADKLRSGREYRIWLAWGLFLLFLAADVWIVWPIECRDDLLDAVLTACVAVYAAVKLSRAVFENVLEGICRSCWYAANVYDLCMLARVRIGDEHGNGAVHAQSGDAGPGIAYFLEQEQTKSLYHAVPVRNAKGMWRM